MHRRWLYKCRWKGWKGRNSFWSLLPRRTFWKKLEIKIGNELAGGKGNSTPNPDCKNAGKEGLGGNGGDGVGLYIDGKPIAVAAGGGGGNGGKKEKSENINGTNANSDMQNKTIGKQGENGINIGAGGGGGGEYGGKAGTGGYTSTVTDKSCTSMDGTNNCIVKGKLADELINQLSDEDKEKIKNSSSYAIVQVIKDSSASL